MDFTARVFVTPKAAILDPEGKAVASSLHSLGYDEVADARLGKLIELKLRRRRPRRREARVDEMCRRLLANEIIEDYRFESGGEREVVKWGVVVFPGSNDDRDAALRARLRARATTSQCSGTATQRLQGVDAVVLPGGFSYGDYLRCGAMARFSPVMRAVDEHANGRRARCSASATASRFSVRRGCCPARWCATASLRFICRSANASAWRTPTTAFTARLRERARC